MKLQKLKKNMKTQPLKFGHMVGLRVGGGGTGGRGGDLQCNPAKAATGFIELGIESNEELMTMTQAQVARRESDAC